jgi:hypothetical protein
MQNGSKVYAGIFVSLGYRFYQVLEFRKQLESNSSSSSTGLGSKKQQKLCLSAGLTRKFTLPTAGGSFG